MSKFPSKLLRGRRSTASLVLSVTALFVALSGGAVAAVLIPDNSVGTAQLQNGAVSNAKLARGAVHSANLDANEVQNRVSGTCAKLSAVTGVRSNGTVSCYRAISASVVTPGTSQNVADPGSTSLLAEEPLPTPAAYVVDADPSIQVSGAVTANEQVTVTCELSATGASPDTESATVDLFPTIQQGDASLHLGITVPAAATQNQAAVACAANHTGTVAPTVGVSAGITALQTLHNTGYSSQNTTTAPLTVTTPTVATTTATPAVP